MTNQCSTCGAFARCLIWNVHVGSIHLAFIQAPNPIKAAEFLRAALLTNADLPVSSPRTQCGVKELDHRALSLAALSAMELILFELLDYHLVGLETW